LLKVSSEAKVPIVFMFYKKKSNVLERVKTFLSNISSETKGIYVTVKVYLADPVKLHNVKWFEVCH
jgi:hypothetical protein